jgi:aminoglycoside phosphotransferase (APT) family kinase protein
MVLRRPPFGSKVKSAHDMSREFRVLSKLHKAYPLAPEVIHYCEDTQVLGATFYLMNPIRGVVLRRELPAGLEVTAAMARRLSENFIDNLARLHSLDYSAIGLGDLGKPQGYLERNVKGWIERYRNSATHALPEVESIVRWMMQKLPSSNDATLIHNDYKYDNVVLDPSDITHIVGVLDWEMCTVGDPLSDLGTTLAYWAEANDAISVPGIGSAPTALPGALSRRQLVERYQSATGRDVGDIAFYLTFARFKVAVIGQQIYYRYAQGLTQDERFASMPDKVAALMAASLDCAKTGRI